jgi:hypothetical protein
MYVKAQWYFFDDETKNEKSSQEDINQLPTITNINY